MIQNQQISFFDLEQKSEKYVRRITYDETKPFLLGIHYARRMPCITDAFGLFVDSELVGVVTYGVPASRPLCVGLAGIENERKVLELNRLVIKPELNGGVKTMPVFWLGTLSKCFQMAHSLFRMQIQHGHTLVMYIRRVISYTLVFLQNV